MPSDTIRRTDRHPPASRLLVLVAISLVVLLSSLRSAASPTADPLPTSLQGTGLYLPGPGLEVDPAHLAFSPQYPLWTDGARKRRWLSLPPNTYIDGSRPNAWEFPVGTRLWKEFSQGHRPIETRYIERLADGKWRYATYVWNETGTGATLAPAEGLRLAIESKPHHRYIVPGENDCRTCHEGAAVPVLGVSALQLSPDRDPLAPHADAFSPTDLRTLIERGLLRNVPKALLHKPPRIATDSPLERAALGYLHGNCGHCHNADGSPLPVDVRLAQDVSRETRSANQVLPSLIGASSRFRAPGLPHDARVIAPGRPEASTLLWRIRSNNPQTQMPPLGVQARDDAAIALLERWIAGLSTHHDPEK